MSSTDSRFGPSARPFTFYSVMTARKAIMKTVKKRYAAHLAAPPKGRACHPREGRASQPYFEDFEALTSSQGVLYLKNSATTIKHLLQPFQKLEKGYGRNLHGFSADIENFLKRLQGVIDFLDRENEIPTRPDVIAGVIDFLDRENEIPTRPDVIAFLKERRDIVQAALDVTSDQLRRSRALHQETIALPPSAPPPENVVLPKWVQALHASHTPLWCGGFVLCEACGGTAAKNVDKSKLLVGPCSREALGPLAFEQMKDLSAGSLAVRTRLRRLLSGRLPRHYSAWPDEARAPADVAPTFRLRFSGGVWWPSAHEVETVD